MVIKVLTIANQQFQIGFKLTVFGTRDLLYVGCFDLDNNLTGYGLEQTAFKMKNADVCTVSEKVRGQADLGCLSVQPGCRWEDHSPHFTFKSRYD